MTSVILIGAAVYAVALVTVCALRWWTWRPVERRRALVQIVDGSTIEGVILSRRGPLLVLGDARIISGGSSKPIDGQVVVERPNVAWLQVVS